jgi:simple sugar transport system ATP-binding protein
MAMNALSCHGISKRFGSTTALSQADFQVAESEIHALVGENGAGKSTLLNIISGLLAPDSGALEVFGQAVRFSSPLDAAAAGIGVVHQHFLLADALTVAENVALGIRTSPMGCYFDRPKAEAAVAELADRTGLAIDPAARVADLPVGLRQRVEILKALSRGARILLLDEPTAVLAPPEVSTLFETLRALRQQGRTIVIVTHKLDEVFALSSTVTVLRRGQTVLAGPLSGLTPATLAAKMIGQDSERKLEAGTVPDNAGTILDMQNILVPGVLSIDSLRVKSGEIVGIAGVEGNGQTELAAVIAGTLKLPESEGPTIWLEDRLLNTLDAGERSAKGVAYIPADRHHEGLILDFSLTDNLHARNQIFWRIAGLPLLDHKAMTLRSAELLREYGAVPPIPELPARSLSGGNQQKVVIARELSRKPRLILACNPTRGLDVGAAADVHARLLAAARTARAGVLLISSDLDEVLLLADRVVVLYRGALKEIGIRGVSKETAGRAMVGAA